MELRQRTKDVASYAISCGIKDAARYYGLEQSSVRREVRYFKEFHKFNGATRMRAPKPLVLDIETAPMIAFIWSRKINGWIPSSAIIEPWWVITWSAKWLMTDETFHGLVTPEEALARDDSRILKEIWALMDEADVIIWHNGNSFDRRRLNTRFIKHGMIPTSPYNLIDTLHAAKKDFDFPGNDQDFLAKYLDLPRKKKTDFSLWVRCLEGDKKALKEMSAYCDRDIGGLEELYFALRPWMKSHPNMALFGELDGKKACHRCGNTELEWAFEYATPMNIYDAARCNKCNGFTRSSKTALTKEERKTLTRSIAH